MCVEPGDSVYTYVCTRCVCVYVCVCVCVFTCLLYNLMYKLSHSVNTLRYCCLLLFIWRLSACRHYLLCFSSRMDACLLTCLVLFCYVCTREALCLIVVWYSVELVIIVLILGLCGRLVIAFYIYIYIYISYTRFTFVHMSALVPLLYLHLSTFFSYFLPSLYQSSLRWYLDEISSGRLCYDRTIYS